MTAAIIDTAARLTANPAWLPALPGKGIKTCSQYLTDLAHDRAKLPTNGNEVRAITAAGMTVLANFEGAGADPNAFTRAKGLANGRYARAYGFSELKMPPGAAIYFSTEARFDAAYIKSNVEPYFDGVKQAMTESSAAPSYKIGAYSSGSVLEALIDFDPIDYYWLANALGWQGSRAFLASGKWQIRQLPTVNGFLPGLNVDPDMVNPAYTGSIGDFTVAGVVVAPQPADQGPDTDHPTISRGATGDAVTELQKLLNVVLETNLAVDGQFGPATQKAVTTFQTQNDLTSDGVVGDETWAALQAQQQGV